MTSSRRSVPAGESPVRVSAGALGSRPQARGEILAARAGCRKPGERDRKQSCGPQRAVNAEQASSDPHPKGDREGRDRHVGSKATDSAPDPERALDLPGVLAAARSEGTVRNRRGPPWWPTSGEAASISAEREVSPCQEGVRGGRSTGEAADNAVEGRAPASVTRTVQVRARAWPRGPTTRLPKYKNCSGRYGGAPSRARHGASTR